MDKKLWTPAPTTWVRQCVMMGIFGDTGVGKTTLALTAPGPIAYMVALDKTEGVIQEAARRTDMQMHDFGTVIASNDPDVIAQEAHRKWELFKASWYDAFGWARTIVLDTHTEAWELLRLARFGGLKPTGGRVDANYGPVNNEWRSLFKHQRQQNKTNVILIGQTKDEYKNASSGVGQRTGRTIEAGQREIGYLCDIRVRMEKASVEGDSMFLGTIVKGWFNAQSEGHQLMNEGCNFGAIMGSVTGRPKEDWE